MAGLCVAAIMLAASPRAAEAHGRMTSPASRNLVHNAINHLGNANGAVGGGPGSVHLGGRYLHGICGDAPGESQIYNRVGAVQAVYSPGQVVEFKLKLTAHHMGFFEFELCEHAEQLSEECFAKNRLLREGCECHCTDGSRSCAKCDVCRQWWKPLMSNETIPSAYQGPVIDGEWKDEVEFTMKYVLPAGIRTSRGVIRWHYMTTNSCTSTSASPEEFWNCADVAIEDGSNAGAPVNFDNDALAAAQPLNLREAIDNGRLLGVYSACPLDAHGKLQMVGSPSQYTGACGASNERCKKTGGKASNPTSDDFVAPSPTPALAGCGDGCSECVAVPNNPAATGDDACSPCAAGQTWWPCNAVGLCQCASGSAGPEPSPTAMPTSMPTAAPTTVPTVVPTDAPTSAPTAAPTAAPTSAPTATPSVVSDSCQVAGGDVCQGCLATNNVCYAVDKGWCDDRASLNFIWCGQPELVEVHRAKVKKHTFLGTALLQTATPLVRTHADSEL